MSFRALSRQFTSTQLGILLKLSAVTAGGEAVPELPLPLELVDVLTHYGEVFSSSTGLPPHRAVDHRIVLKEAIPPSIRPYRYPHIQKGEIERLVSKMLSSGIIWPSSNPYSSPDLLVKKRDGSWRFCVDYRAFNQLTVPEKFPIPIIDELLDELHGAAVLTKLDLKVGYHQSGFTTTMWRNSLPYT